MVYSIDQEISLAINSANGSRSLDGAEIAEVTMCVLLLVSRPPIIAPFFGWKTEENPIQLMEEEEEAGSSSHPRAGSQLTE